MRNNNYWARFQLSALAVVGLVYSLQATAVEYTITDLGTLGGPSSFALGINNNAQVVGFADTVAAPGHAFLYSSGVMTDLGTLYGNARAINNSGQIVGGASTSGNPAFHAFSYSGGVMTDLGVSGATGATWSEAEGINDLGQIAIYAGSSGPNNQAYLYSGGVMTNLGTLGGSFSAPAGINNSGQIAGVSALDSAGTVLNAFLYSGGVMTNLGTLGGSYSGANGLNNLGQVVGASSTVTNAGHAFLYSSGTMVDLGTLGGSWSTALGISNTGLVVGRGDTADGAEHAFLYSGGAMTDLNALLSSSSEWTLTDARSINDNGQIVGQGTINGVQHAFLMTPVPVPAAFWLFGSGLVGLFGFMRRGRVQRNN